MSENCIKIHTVPDCVQNDDDHQGSSLNEENGEIKSFIIPSLSSSNHDTTPTKEEREGDLEGKVKVFGYVMDSNVKQSKERQNNLKEA